jgi:hypothetical protein
MYWLEPVAENDPFLPEGERCGPPLNGVYRSSVCISSSETFAIQGMYLRFDSRKSGNLRIHSDLPELGGSARLNDLAKVH